MCEFDYYTATFQGERTAAEIVAALREVFRQQRENKYDAVIILRGGGSQADLAWLNDYEISSAIAKMSLPVMVAIGHERDAVILDEIACVSFHTPSKAIAHVAGTIVSNARQAIGNVESIVAATNKAMALAQGRIDSVLGSVKHFAESDWDSAAQAITAAKATVIDQARGACGLVAVSLENERTRVHDSAVRNQEKATTGIDAWREAVRRDSARLHGSAEAQMASAVSVVHGHATRGLTVAEQQIASWQGLIRDRSLLASDQTLQRVEPLGQLVEDNTRRQVAVVEAEIERHRLLTRDRSLLGVQTTRESLKALGEFVIGLGPKKTLERGFVMTKRRGKAVTRKAQVKPGDVLEVDFADGNVDAVVQ